MRWILSCLAAGLALTAFAEPPKPVKGDEQDLIFFEKTRPYRLRLHLQVAQNSFQRQWDNVLAAMFDYLDYDHNGVLSAAELLHAPNAEQFRQMVLGLEPDAAPPPEMKELTDDPHAGVTRAQLKGYYRRSGVAGWQAEWVARSSATDLYDNRLFEMLNPAHDDKISRSQLKNAATILFKLDTDGDEMITLPELAPNLNYQGFMGPTLLKGPMVLTDLSDKGRALIAARILDTYDTKKTKKLSRTELPLPSDQFTFLDTDKNGVLDAHELQRWTDLPPDLEVLIRLDAPPSEGVFVIPGPTGQPHTLAPVTHFSRLGAATVDLKNDRLEVLRVESEPGGLTPTQRTNMQQFKALDTNHDGVLDSKEIFQPPFTFVPILKLADRNGDNKISEQEFLDYLALQRKLQTQTVTITIVDRGRSLFDLIDADHDRRLSRRELMTLADRVAPWIDAKTDALARFEIPNQYQIILSHGVLRSNDGDPGSGAIIRPTHRLRGPLWFRKMDRNADGDVSRAEFLGTEAQFRKLDRNGDGLIDVEEAEQAERKK